MKLKKVKPCDHSCLMCQHVMREWYDQIDLRKQTIKLKRGEQFIVEGDAVRGVYFVQSGVVKVHRRWGDKEMIVRFARKGDIVGHRGVSSASEQSVYPISATALEAATLCFVDIDFFLSTLRVNAALTYRLMLFYADELQLSEQKMYNLVQKSVKSRLAWSLLSLYSVFGEQSADGYLGITISKTDLGGYIGATYETVYRSLADLVRLNYIRMEGKKIYLTTLDALQQLANEQV